MPKIPKKLLAAAGDCFVVAGHTMMDGIDKVAGHHFKLVHAIVKGTGGKVKGKPLHHAWVELGDVVFDRSAGKNIVMRKERYYELASVEMKRGKYAVYNQEEAMKKMLQTGKFGPWDLDG